MYNGIQRIEEVIDHIEDNITSEINCDELASKMNLSVYEFRRIFAFIVGCPISEYIRRRRLSLAALEIITGDKADLSAISEKYGYSSQSAFTKAFGEQHGVSPTVYMKEAREINLFTRPKFSLNISGRETVSFKILEEEEFYIEGFSGVSSITDSCCCEKVWNEFYESGADSRLSCDKIHVSYRNEGDSVNCTIGAAVKTAVSGSDTERIPASRFACFVLNTVNDDKVNEIYSKILYEWLPSANLKRRTDVPTVEVYPFDMTEDGFAWEIRIPIE